MTVPDVVQISQLGKIVDGKLRLGKLVRKELADGKFTSEIKMTRQSIPLGNGVELATDMPPAPNAVWLSVTAEAAKRHGWEHPANKPARTEADIPKLCAIVGNQSYGQQEQAQAIRDIATIDPVLGQTLTAANQWLFGG